MLHLWISVVYGQFSSPSPVTDGDSRTVVRGVHVRLAQTEVQRLVRRLFNGAGHRTTGLKTLLTEPQPSLLKLRNFTLTAKFRAEQSVPVSYEHNFSGGFVL